ncbi:MAG: PTS IIA-like nitrogen regulatory protein PtsN [Ahrensia sp.]
MELGDFLSRDAVITDIKASSKKQVLQALSEKASELTGLSAREIFDTIVQREKLGSTGVGNGVAIPHGKFGKYDRITGVFVRLEEPVDFDALDDQPVDMIMMLLAPEEAGADHLKALSRVARAMRDRQRMQAIRNTTDADTIHALMTDPAQSDAA